MEPEDGDDAGASGDLPSEASAGLGGMAPASPAAGAEGGSHDDTPRGWFDRLLAALGGIAGLVILFLMLAVSAEVLVRYFTGRPLGWTVEASEVALLYLTFLSAAWVLRQDGHIKVDLLAHVLPARAQAVLGVVTSALGAVACAVIVIYGAQVTWELFERGARSPTLLRLPQAPIIGVIPFGMLFLAIEFGRRVLRYGRALRDD